MTTPRGRRRLRERRRSAPGVRYRASGAADIWPPLIAAAGALLLLVWVGGGGYRQDLVGLACTYALIAIGMYIPFVLAGSLSMAYSAYASIGAFSVGVISHRTELPLWMGWLLGAVVSAVVAIILSMVTRRLSGFFLAAVTLLFGVAFESWLVSAEGITGGAAGIGDIRPVDFLGWEPTRGTQIILAILAVLVITTLTDRVRRSPWGVVVRSMRETPLPVAASGVSVSTLTTLALAVGAAISSFGGALFAGYVGGITPETFTVSVVFLAIFMPLIGGRGTAWGAVVGAVIVVELTVNFSLLAGAGGQLILSVGVLLILLIAPSGVLGGLNKGGGWLLQRVRPRTDHDAGSSGIHAPAEVAEAAPPQLVTPASPTPNRADQHG